MEVYLIVRDADRISLGKTDEHTGKLKRPLPAGEYMLECGKDPDFMPVTTNVQVDSGYQVIRIHLVVRPATLIVKARVEEGGSARAEVYDIHGKYLGRTDERLELAPGEHQLVVKMDEYEDCLLLCKLHSGGQTEDVKLKHKSRLLVSTDPPEVKVLVVAEAGPFRTNCLSDKEGQLELYLGRGKYKLTFEREGFAVTSKAIETPSSSSPLGITLKENGEGLSNALSRLVAKEPLASRASRIQEASVRLHDAEEKRAILSRNAKLWRERIAEELGVFWLRCVNESGQDLQLKVSGFPSGVPLAKAESRDLPMTAKGPAATVELQARSKELARGYEVKGTHVAIQQGGYGEWSIGKLLPLPGRVTIRVPRPSDGPEVAVAVRERGTRGLVAAATNADIQFKEVDPPKDWEIEYTRTDYQNVTRPLRLDIGFAETNVEGWVEWKPGPALKELFDIRAADRRRDTTLLADALLCGEAPAVQWPGHLREYESMRSQWTLRWQSELRTAMDSAEKVVAEYRDALYEVRDPRVLFVAPAQAVHIILPEIFWCGKERWPRKLMEFQWQYQRLDAWRAYGASLPAKRQELGAALLKIAPSREDKIALSSREWAMQHRLAAWESELLSGANSLSGAKAVQEYGPVVYRWRAYRYQREKGMDIQDYSREIMSNLCWYAKESNVITVVDFRLAAYAAQRHWQELSPAQSNSPAWTNSQKVLARDFSARLQELIAGMTSTQQMEIVEDLTQDPYRPQEVGDGVTCPYLFILKELAILPGESELQKKIRRWLEEKKGDTAFEEHMAGILPPLNLLNELLRP